MKDNFFLFYKPASPCLHRRRQNRYFDPHDSATENGKIKSCDQFENNCSNINLKSVKKTIKLPTFKYCSVNLILMDITINHQT